MSRRNTLSLLLLMGLTGALPSCKRKEEPNKILDNLPVNSDIVVLPALATQEMILLHRDAMQTIVPVVNRLGQTGQIYPELTGPDGSSQYTFQRSDSHYGTANFTIQFRDNLNAVIDPITNINSTTTLNSVVITASGNSSLFTYSESLTLTLTTVGMAESDKYLTSSASFSGSTYNLTFTLPSPGAKAIFTGLTDGSMSASGSGGPSNQAASLALTFSINHTADGTLTWEGSQGGVHYESNGTGSIVTNEYRIFIE